MFELPNNTECTLTSFTGRVQKSGPDDVPAVSIRLKLKSVSNVIIDMLSKTMRLTAYAPIDDQEQLPGVELTTPILRSKDLKHWAPENCFDGWRVIVARGITDDSALQMGSCKIDRFNLDFFDGGHVDCEFNVSTADIDEAGAGMLWGLQRQPVFVMITAPEAKPEPIDGSPEGGGPGFKAPGSDAGDLFAAARGSADPDDSDDPDGEGSETDAEPEPRTDLPRTVKYRSPQTGETWSGRGRKPAWLEKALATGQRLEDFLVERVAA